MSTLSVCIIAKDEESVLSRCLDSIKDIADEIVLCDTGSKDRTVEIAKSYPQCKVVHFEWCDDFAAARNHSFSYASCELVMWLDCDDIVKPREAEKIKQLKNQNVSQLKDCYVCIYHYAHDHLDNPTTSLKRERIFKRSANPVWQYKIHECVPLSRFRDIEYNSDIAIDHYKTVHQIQRAEGRNVKILRKCVEDPALNCARYEFYLGKELVTESPNEAEIYLKRYLQHYDWYEDAFYATFQLGHIEFNRKNYDAAANYCFDALKIDQRRGDVFCFLGLIYINKSRYDLAKFWYKVSLLMPRPKDSLGFFDESQHTYVPNVQLSYVCYLNKEYEEALKYAEDALKYRPDDWQAKQNKKLAKLALGLDPAEPKKWAIYIPFNYDIGNPNIRLRKINIQKELKRKNINADIVKDFKNLKKYDYILSHTLFSESEINELKLQGKIVGYDLAEGWFDENFANQIKDYNLVTCSSSKLANYCKKFNVNAVHLPDSYEV